MINQCLSMYKINLVLTIVLLLSSPVYAADLLDIYNRSLDFNNELKIKNNDHKISEELYNQTASTIFPEINIIANTEETNINKYAGPGTTNDYSSETASLKITQPLLRLYFFDELNKANSKRQARKQNRNNVVIASQVEIGVNETDQGIGTDVLTTEAPVEAPIKISVETGGDQEDAK